MSLQNGGYGLGKKLRSQSFGCRNVAKFIVSLDKKYTFSCDIKDIYSFHKKYFHSKLRFYSIKITLKLHKHSF